MVLSIVRATIHARKRPFECSGCHTIISLPPLFLPFSVPLSLSFSLSLSVCLSFSDPFSLSVSLCVCSPSVPLSVPPLSQLLFFCLSPPPPPPYLFLSVPLSLYFCLVVCVSVDSMSFVTKLLLFLSPCLSMFVYQPVCFYLSVCCSSFVFPSSFPTLSSV